MKTLKSKLKNRIRKKFILSIFIFIVLGFFLCFICINSLSRKYTAALADSAAEFTASVINADDAKNYIITRKKDDNYNDVLDSLCTYAGNSESISRISLVSFSNSAGYYIFDTGGENLGTKVDYDEYNLSVKAELINGKNKWYHSDKGNLYSYVPLRTVDDRLAGYIITTLIRHKNFMIENNQFLVYSVGANRVRPLGLQNAPTGEHSSPLQKQYIELALIKIMFPHLNTMYLRE